MPPLHFIPFSSNVARICEKVRILLLLCNETPPMQGTSTNPETKGNSNPDHSLVTSFFIGGCIVK